MTLTDQRREELSIRGQQQKRKGIFCRFPITVRFLSLVFVCVCVPSLPHFPCVFWSFVQRFSFFFLLSCCTWLSFLLVFFFIIIRQAIRKKETDKGNSQLNIR